ncbi:MAG: hypothetical protein R3C20_03460 [Planctomycetaceae bacterium]
MRDVRKPIRFQCHGYNPLELIVPPDLKPDAEGIYDVGVVRMRRCAPDELANISGVVKREGGHSSSKITVSLRHRIVSPNTVSGGYSGGSSNSVVTTESPDGSWALKDVAPGDYYVSFYSNPHTGHSQQIILKASETKEIALSHWSASSGESRFYCHGS